VNYHLGGPAAGDVYWQITELSKKRYSLLGIMEQALWQRHLLERFGGYKFQVNPRRIVRREYIPTVPRKMKLPDSENSFRRGRLRTLNDFEVSNITRVRVKMFVNFID
jgi:hypothetical protein